MKKEMFQVFANIFGYLLGLLYNLINNYGLAIILFTIIIKIILLPLSYKQQKSMKKNAELQDKMKTIQFKYKNDQEKMNEEIMKMYKEEKMNPFSGCLTAIIQMILLLSIFYLVRSPLTFMQKVPIENLNQYKTQLQEEGKEISNVYSEIDLIREYNFLKEKNPEDINIDKLDLKMNFFGLDLSKIPKQNFNDLTVYIIPVLYIISSFISIKITIMEQEKINKNNEKNVVEGEEEKKEDATETDTMMQTNKMMNLMIPFMSISIALVAPLGLALYWLVNNILMILERLILNKVIKG